MVLDASMCDQLVDVSTLMLREKNLLLVDDNLDGVEENRLRLKELCNIEVLYASHNYIRNVLGVS